MLEIVSPVIAFIFDHGVSIVIMVCAITVASVIGRLITTPTRPTDDPYAKTEFGENGVPLSQQDSTLQ